MNDLPVQQACIDAYLSGVDARPQDLAYGAILVLGGMADNGGLVGGVGKLLLGDSSHVIDDGVAGLRRFALTDVADLVERASAEHRRMRPTGHEHISAEDEALGEVLDEEWFRLTAGGEMDQTATVRPGLQGDARRPRRTHDDGPGRATG